MAQQAKKPGLKALRSGHNADGPKYHCSNCKCDRYSKCTCMKAKDYKEPDAETT